jgi:hypothetical protein
VDSGPPPGDLLGLLLCFCGCLLLHTAESSKPAKEPEAALVSRFVLAGNSFGHQAITIFNKCLNQMPPNTIYSPWQASDNTHKMTRQTERWQKCSFLKTETKSKYFQREFHINYLNIYKVG